MEILLTALSLAALCGCFLAFTRTQRVADEASTWARSAEKSAMALKSERDRITVLERELDALRRELRKLSGKFYARQRERELEEEWPAEVPCAHADRDGNGVCRWCGDVCGVAQPCENWALAKQEGPSSAAAKCECLYCMSKRADRERLRRDLVPKGAQATAATAKLNAGKP